MIEDKKDVTEFHVEREIQIQEMADVHARVSTLESQMSTQSRRITRLENRGQGHFDDDPMNMLFSPTMLCLYAVIALAPVVLEMVKTWRSSQLSPSSQ